MAGRFPFPGCSDTQGSVEHYVSASSGPSNPGEECVSRALTALAVLVVLIAAACNGDAQSTETDSPASTDPPTTPAPADPPTTPPPTTAAPTTLPPTTAAPSTTLDVEALKAQIAADYERSWELRDELATSPTLEGLPEKLAQIAVPGSSNYARLEEFVRELVEMGHHVIDGEPAYSTADVETVELNGTPPYDRATIVVCYVSNRIRVDDSNTPLEEPRLFAVRGSATVVSTPNGWLPDGDTIVLWEAPEVTECPPA